MFAPLNETYFDVVRRLLKEEVSTKCINEESTNERGSYNRQVKRIFSSIMPRPGSMRIKQDLEGLL